MLLTLVAHLGNAIARAPGPTPGDLDNPDPQAPTNDLNEIAELWISWGKWGVMITGVLGLFISAGMMAIGRKNRSHLAAEGATGIPWVVAALSVATLAVPFVNQIL